MSFTNRVSFTTVLEKAAASILDAYSSFSATAQIGDILIIQNLTDEGVMLSFSTDSADNLPLASSGHIVLDFNKFITESNVSLSKSTIIKVKRLVAGVAPTTGSVWISIVYNQPR